MGDPSLGGAREMSSATCGLLIGRFASPSKAFRSAINSGIAGVSAEPSQSIKLAAWIARKPTGGATISISTGKSSFSNRRASSASSRTHGLFNEFSDQSTIKQRMPCSASSRTARQVRPAGMRRSHHTLKPADSRARARSPAVSSVFVCVTDENVGHKDRSKSLALNAGSYKGSERRHCSKTGQFCNEEFTRDHLAQQVRDDCIPRTDLLDNSHGQVIQLNSTRRDCPCESSMPTAMSKKI